MRKKLIFTFSIVLIIAFLAFPSFTYTENTEGCSSDPYANCTPGRDLRLGQFFGGINYIKASFNAGYFSIDETLVLNAPKNNGGFYEGESQYFKPSTASIGAGLVSAFLTTAYYLSRNKLERPKI